MIAGNSNFAWEVGEQHGESCELWASLTKCFSCQTVQIKGLSGWAGQEVLSLRLLTPASFVKGEEITYRPPSALVQWWCRVQLAVVDTELPSCRIWARFLAGLCQMHLSWRKVAQGWQKFLWSFQKRSQYLTVSCQELSCIVLRRDEFNDVLMPHLVFVSCDFSDWLLGLAKL